MALTRVVAAQQIVIANLNQLIDLLTGVMTDQPVTINNTVTSNNTITGASLVPSGLTGSVQAMRLVGATTTGAPTTGAHLVGDAALAQDGFWWICTSGGTPGTWKLAGAALETATPAALNASGTVGTSLNAAHGDHAHPSTGLGVLANAQAWAGKQTLNAGAALGGGTLDLQGAQLRFAATPTQGAYMTDDGTYLNFTAQTARSFYVQSNFATTYIYSNTIYLGDGSTGGNTTHLRNATIDGTSWSITSGGVITATGLALSANAGNTVPTLPSGNGAKIWIQSTDPAGSAANGDVWIRG